VAEHLSKIIVPADSTVPVIDDSNIDSDMESADKNCFGVHNRSLPHFIASSTVPVCWRCSFNLLSSKLINNDKGIFKCLRYS
jgi:hypothetical protein